MNRNFPPPPPPSPPRIPLPLTIKNLADVWTAAYTTAQLAHKARADQAVKDFLLSYKEGVFNYE